MAEPIISVQGLGKKYRLHHQRQRGYSTLRDAVVGWFKRSGVATDSDEDFWALRDISFEVEPGQVVGIIGRNGAGKSTLLKVLSQIVEPTTGSVRLNGRVASLLEVGTGFHPELSGRENVYLNGAILGMSRKEIVRKFDEIVAFAEVERFLDTPVKHYSSGMYVRLAFAVAAHLEPEILVVDEVLAVGDMEFQKKCLGKMQDVSRGGRTVLFVSHNMGAVSSLCDRGIVLERGSVTYNGPVEEALALYSQMSSKALDSQDHAPDMPRVVGASVDGHAAAHGNIRVRVAFESPRVLTSPHLGVVLMSSNGTPLFGFDTDMDVDFDPAPAERGEIELVINDAPLHTGTYRVTIWFGEKGTGLNRVDDAVAFHFIAPTTVPAGVSLDYIGYTRVKGQFKQSGHAAALA